MTTTPPAPAPDREALQRIVAMCEQATERRIREAQVSRSKGWPSGETPADLTAACEEERRMALSAHPVLLAAVRFWLAREPASDRFIDQTYLHLPPKERNNDRFTLGWRACERHHAIAAPPADAGEKEDLNK